MTLVKGLDWIEQGLASDTGQRTLIGLSKVWPVTLVKGLDWIEQGLASDTGERTGLDLNTRNTVNGFTCRRNLPTLV